MQAPDTSPPVASARELAWPLAIVALALVSLGAPLCWLSGHELATQYEDDAFYYFQIAKNVGLGRGFSFDGLHATNGFHPLWLALLVPLFRWLPPLDAPVRAAGLLEALLLGCAGALVHAVMRRQQAPRWSALAAGVLVFALPGTRSLTRVGLESALCMCLLAGIWRALPRQPAEGSAPWLRLGGLCALALLARLEALCALGCLLWLLRVPLMAAPRRALWLVGPPLVTFALYLTWNRLGFGTWLPVSGLVKQQRAAEHFRGALGLCFVPLAQLLLTAAGCWALWRGCERRAAWLAGLRFPVITAFGMLGLDYASLGHVERWYQGVALLAAAPLLASLLRASPTSSWVALAGCSALALGRVPYTVHSVRTEEYQAEVRGEAADWLRRHLPPGTRVGAWNGGMFGYYSGQHVVMLDGLANSPAFYRRAIVGGDTLGYLEDEHIDHLVTMSCGFDPLLWTQHTVDEDRRIARRYQRQGPLSDRRLSNPCHDAFQLWVKRPQ